ncbi:alpha-protein kinase vwkA-like [Patiria miniata]|uniref:Alpha-type protein kinase domain-containing protein n=1 Tax=Patiria miniata TaxID=46514 RepID=A0A914BAX5_PATMI|nr:alpha-protein kinase vwkA-like [Patiria miniata]
MGNAQSHKSEQFSFNGRQVCARFNEDDLISEGESRCTFRGIIKPIDSHRFQSGKNCVVRMCTKRRKDNVNEYNWQPKARIEIAMKMAQQFNESGRSHEMISFPYPGFTTVKKVRPPVKCTVYEGAPLIIERYLHDYSWFLSNSSHVLEPTKLPSAFCHFTYHQSNGAFLVTNLKGVQKGSRYTFTDPAIHSCEEGKFGYYGRTDLGVYGMIKFFSVHICTHICEGLLTPDKSKIPRMLNSTVDAFIDRAIAARPAGSTYDVELLHHGLKPERIRTLHNEIAAALAGYRSP